MLEPDLVNFIKSSITLGKKPLLDENEIEAVKIIDMLNTMRENCVIWDRTKTVINITKCYDDLNLAKYLENLFDLMTNDFLISIDFHGFYFDRTDYIFAWGSRNTNMVPDNLMKVTSEKNATQIIEYFNMGEHEIMKNWFANHEQCLGIEESGFQPYSIRSVLISIEILDMHSHSSSESNSDSESEDPYYGFFNE